MKLVHIHLVCKNAAFEDWQSETSRILRNLADKLDRDDGRVDEIDWPLIDANGNKVGSFKFEIA